MSSNAFFKIPYGLYVLSTSLDGKQNACIVNTFLQVANEPLRVSVAVSKQNFTCDLITKSGKFAVSVLTQTTPFEVFKRFGFQSGKVVDKFNGCDYVTLSTGGLPILNSYVSAVFEATVCETVDVGSHIVFIADVGSAVAVGDGISLTYDYYQTNIKPRPEAIKKSGWRCIICNYVYEGDPLPADFICPICKHGAADFVKI